MGEKLEALEKKVSILENRIEEGARGGGGEGGKGEGGYRGIDEETVDRMKGIGRKLELKKREERRNNIVIRRLEGGVEDTKERVGKMIKEIGAEVEIEWIRRIRGKEGVEREMVVVGLGSREQKRQVMEKKKGLKGKMTRIEDDLTWGEKRMKWKIGEIAEEERRKGNRVWTGYGKIRINEGWWRWDEEKGRLKNWRGEIRGEGEDKGGKVEVNGGLRE
ncbi:hypothetical protein RF55_9593 [Lasius niger]|uniref:Uncharacterized protein n=1 Tax=Lasius niger TaxID=67767 RepID=A0A0J7NDN9_LASNI|nr:hypothetical protein RF55_9593 [Lasius niger]